MIRFLFQLRITSTTAIIKLVIAIVGINSNVLVYVGMEIALFLDIVKSWSLILIAGVLLYANISIWYTFDVSCDNTRD